MQRLRCRCQRINEKGQGVGYTEDNIVVFASEWLLGEEAELQVIERKPTYIIAKLLSLMTRSPQRQQPLCPHFGRCGGCQLQHLSIPAQQALKETFFREHWQAQGLDPIFLQWVSAAAWGYRAKMILPVEWPLENDIVPKVGFYKTHSRKLEPIQYCPIHTPPIEKLIQELPQWFMRWVQSWPFESQKEKPWQSVHFVYARQTFREGPIHLALGFKQKISDKNWAKRWMTCKPSEISLHGLSSLTSSTLSNVWLEGEAVHEVGPCKMQLKGAYPFEIDPFAFQQVHPEMATEIKDQIVKWVKELNPKQLLELFCGAGVLANALSKETGLTVIGVDNLQANIESAKHNASKISSQAQFFCEDALYWLQHYNQAKAQLWVLNPPRKGLGIELTEILLEKLPAHVIYMACGQKAFAQDAKKLSRAYELVEIKAYDMFAQTMHFETLSLWKRR